MGILNGFLRRLPRQHRYCVEVRDRAFSEDPRAGQQLERVLGNVGAEWLPFDTAVLFGQPPGTATQAPRWCIMTV